jgi:hypothetical protein
VGHHSGRGTTAAAMVHSVLADDDSYGVFGTSKHTDSYIRNNNRRVKKELQIFAILAAGTAGFTIFPTFVALVHNQKNVCRMYQVRT